MPNLHKEGYEEAANAGASARDQARDDREEAHARRNQGQQQPRPDLLPQPARPHPFNDPLAAPPRRGPLPDGDIPGFDDEYDVLRHPGTYGQPRASPFNIGHDDLNPPGLGPNDPLRGSFIGGGGGLPRPGGFGGGMHPTFDDPLFGGQRGGGGGYDPMAPPGARYDPVGPQDPRGPQGSGLRRPGGPGGNFPGYPGGGGPYNPYGGDII